MAEYDVEMVYESAERLLLRANVMVWVTTLLWALAGFALGYASARYVLTLPPDSVVVVAVVSGIIGSLSGWLVGTFRADALRMQAQTALCLAAIEENTRVRVRMVKREGGHH